MSVKLFLTEQSVAANISVCIHATFLHLSTSNMLQQKNLKLSNCLNCFHFYVQSAY